MAKTQLPTPPQLQHPSKRLAKEPTPLAMSPERKIVLALDLGSDSTVAYAGLPEALDFYPVDLQFFARALAPQPVVLTESANRRSPRLRSRYAVNPRFSVDAPLQLAQSPTATQPFAVLPTSHATQAIVQHDAFIEEEWKEGQDLSRFGQADGCLFKFFDDQSAPFARDALLPNAKLAFQSSVDFGREFSATHRESGSVQRFRLKPVELIRHQVCLILENFVRNHKLLRDGSYRPPRWDQCDVVLTIPNTYSPLHAELLRQRVEETLGCQVHTISESDALVFYYLACMQPNSRMERGERDRWIQQYLTFDIGKGTTDLSLIEVNYRIPNAVERERLGLDSTYDKVWPHVTVCARTGRPSGGAKATYLVAQFLESLLDFAIRKAAAVRKVKADTEGSPFRLTVQSQSRQPGQTDMARTFLAFESLCESYKRRLDLSPAGATIQDLGATDEALFVASYLAREAIAAFDPKGEIYSDEETEVFKIELRDTICESIQAPTAVRARARKTKDPSLKELDRIWRVLTVGLKAYVKENVDDVLVEIATAHLSGPESEIFRDPSDALRAVVSTAAAERRAEMMDDLEVRTHVVVAGQGSQFAPVKKRMEEIFRRAGLGSIVSEEDLVNAGRSKTLDPTTQRGGLLTKIKKSLGVVESRSKSAIDPYKSCAVELKADRLKDGCAYGALSWHLSEPIMTNPHYVHGQLAMDVLSGGDLEWIDMDTLNTQQGIQLSFRSREARYIYYLPAKGKLDVHPKDMGAVVLARTPACTEVSLRFHKPSRDGGSDEDGLVVFADGVRIPLQDTVYGAFSHDQLRALLWPSVLL